MARTDKWHWQKQNRTRHLRIEPLEDRRMLAVITVDTDLDLVDLNDGLTSLREAIFVANSMPGADEIEFDLGQEGPATIRLTHGELLITDALTISGLGADMLTIDAQEQSRIFNIDDPATSREDFDVVLSGLTLTGGNALDGGAIRSVNAGILTIQQSTISGNSARSGGGVFSSIGAVTINSSSISANSAGLDGGGIFTSSGTVTLSSSTVSSNRTVGHDSKGGGIYSISGAMEFTDSTVNGNRALGDGGGIYTRFGDVALIGSNITGNSTLGFNAEGGGIFTYSGTVTLTNSMVSDNSTVGFDAEGGGIFTDTGAVNLTSSSVSGNSTMGRSSSGGGIYVGSGMVTLSDSIVEYNSTTGSYSEGGGIYTSSGTVTLNNSTVSGNSTTGISSKGGGIYTRSGAVTLNSSTVSNNNTAGAYSDGGGIHTTTGAVTLTSSTVSGNSTAGTDSDGGGIYTITGAVTLTSSTVSGNSTSGTNAEGGGIFAYSGAVDLTSSTVSGNRTTGLQSEGGGIASGNGAVTITRSTISGNSTSGENANGGGIYTRFGALALSSSTVTANSTSSGMGGGVFVADGDINPTWMMENSIVAGNTDDGTAPDLSPDPDSTLNVNHSLIEQVGLPLVGVGNITGLPAGLGPLANNGGPTETHALLPGSPATDAGLHVATITGLFNTGVGSNGELVSDNEDDPHYEIIMQPNSEPISDAAVPADGLPIPPWLANSATSRWIGPDANDAEGSGGNYVYRTTFDLTGFDFTSAALSGLWAADNSGIDILINGISTNQTTSSFVSLTLFTITTGFVAGINTLDFVVFNAGGATINPTGLRVEGLSASAVPTDQRGFPRGANGGAGLQADIGAYEAQATPTAAPGDYNHDGIVNAADYTTWRDSLGATGLAPLSGADGDGDGNVTIVDYDVWKSHYGFVFPLNGGGALAAPTASDAPASLFLSPTAKMQAMGRENGAVSETRVSGPGDGDLFLLALSEPSEEGALEFGEGTLAEESSNDESVLKTLEIAFSEWQ